MDIIFPLIKNHHFMYMQLKSDMNKKILINAIISLKIANRPQNIPTFLMDYKMSYVGSRKSVEAGGGFFFFVRRVPQFYTRRRTVFAECPGLGTRRMDTFAEC